MRTKNVYAVFENSGTEELLEVRTSKAAALKEAKELMPLYEGGVSVFRAPLEKIATYKKKETSSED
jgi:hypothetical protein